MIRPGHEAATGGSDDDLLVLESDDIRVEIVPAIGGRVHRITAFGHDVLRTPPTIAHHRREPFAWGAYPMVPWCNRVPGGRIVFGDRVVDVPTNVDDDGVASAMHGLAYDRPWPVDGDTLRIAGGDELPWPWSARQRFHVDDDTLTVVLALTNEGSEPMPAGVGVHPWFDASAASGGLCLRVSADLVYPSRGKLPVGDPVAVAGPTDLRRLVDPPWGLDAVFTGLASQVAGVEWPGWRLRCAMTYSTVADHLVVAAFDDMGAVAVEPQTHATDGHRRLRDHEPGAIGQLAPGAELTLTVSWIFSLAGR